MVEDLDADVAAAVRRITDRFIRLGKGTPQHEVRVTLGSERHWLDQLIQDQVLRSTGETYLPRLRALDLEDERKRRLCYASTEMVLKAYKRLYSLAGLGPYSIGEVESNVRTEIGRPVDTQLLRVGALFALDFQHYLSSWKLFTRWCDFGRDIA